MILISYFSIIQEHKLPFTILTDAKGRVSIRGYMCGIEPRARLNTQPVYHGMIIELHADIAIVRYVLFKVCGVDVMLTVYDVFRT